MKRILVLLSFLIVSLNGFAQSPFGYPGTVTPFNTTPNFRAGMFLPDTSNSGNFRLRGDTLQVKVNGVWQAATSGGSTATDVFTGTLAQARLLQTAPSTLFITDYGGGTFVKNDTVTVDNTGTQIITAGGQGYSRIYDSEIYVDWFGQTEDATSIIQASIDALGSKGVKADNQKR